MRGIWMSSLSKFLLGLIVGALGFYTFGPTKVETIVEKIKVEVPIVETKTIVKEIQVPKIIEKVVVKEIEVPKYIDKPVIQTINTTRVIYRPLVNVDNLEDMANPEEVECLALNIYREANNQSIAGQIAVGRVVMNRVLDRRYPADTCGVIYEGPLTESWKTRVNPTLKDEDRIYYPKRDRCQFSWYCDGKKDDVIHKENNRAWKTAKDIAYQILAFDKYRGVLEGATHYHANYVSPKWAKEYKHITTIDDHLFYKRD